MAGRPVARRWAPVSLRGGRQPLRLEPDPFAGGLQLRLELRPVGGGPGPVARGPGPIRRSLGSKLRELVEQRGLAFAGRQPEVGCVRVAAPSSLVADLRHPVAVGRRLVPVASGRMAADPVAEALGRRALSALASALICGLVIGGSIAMGRAVPVGRRLVQVRGPLVAVRASLVSNRCRVVRVRGHLVGVGRRLVGIGRHLVGARRLPGVAHGEPERVLVQGLVHGICADLFPASGRRRVALRDESGPAGPTGHDQTSSRAKVAPEPRRRRGHAAAARHSGADQQRGASRPSLSAAGCPATRARRPSPRSRRSG